MALVGWRSREMLSRYAKSSSTRAITAAQRVNVGGCNRAPVLEALVDSRRAAPSTGTHSGLVDGRECRSAAPSRPAHQRLGPSLAEYSELALPSLASRQAR